jgi:hypothetical protein
VVAEETGNKTVEYMKARDKSVRREEIEKREVRESLQDRQDTVKILIDYEGIKLAY